jgi:predicted ATP-grasp superfamily ATP-dependent carboligase
MPEQVDLLVIANSARYLAAAAGRAGLRVSVIDAFGDLDTRARTRHFQHAASMGAEALADAALRLSEQPGAPRRLLYGAGFDGRPDQLRRLRQGFEILGNDADALERVASPRPLFALLGALGIPFPPVSDTAPANPAGWLVKRLASSGGLGVRDAAQAGVDLPADAYFQRAVAGLPVSALFAADGRSVRMLGYSRLRSLALPGTPFVYAGALSWPTPPTGMQRAATTYARRLTSALGLRGINGIDLLLPSAGDQAQRSGAHEPLLLELNARPPATLELHEALKGCCGLLTHLDAVAGQLPSAAPFDPQADAPAVRGLKVLYARQPLRVPALDWPSWCCDRPAPGTEIRAGEPICSLRASGGCEADVETRLDERARALSVLIHGEERQAA